MLNNYVGISIGLGILTLIAGGTAQWLNISPGSLVDWLVGIASFWWLLIIVTIPWNIYFDARETLSEAARSQAKNIKIDLKPIKYVQKIARWSIIGAIVLHLVSAITLYLLAKTGVSNVGYVSSVLTLLLTVLRPAIRGYQYLNTRLLAIKKEVKYPREDILKLIEKVDNLAKRVSKTEARTNIKDPNSLVSKQQQMAQDNRQKILRQQALFEQEQAENQVAHEQLAREARNAIALISEDSQFLGHIREIIRFVKTA